MPKPSKPKEPRTPPQFQSGSCTMAEIAESPERARTFHSRCKGCICSCHQDWNSPRCLQCLELLSPLDIRIGTARCSDRTVCADRVEKLKIERSPEYVKNRRTKIRQRATSVSANARSRIGMGRCVHCGQETKGGQFAVGHDSKLKGSLKKAANDGRETAAIELALRNWANLDVMQKWPAEWRALIDRYMKDENARAAYLQQQADRRWAINEASP